MKAVNGLVAWLRSRAAPASVPSAPGRTKELAAAATIEAASRQAIVFRRHFPPRRGESTRTFFGGAPIAPSEFAWPRPTGNGGSRPFNFLMQIDCADVPAAGRLGLLPDRGVLYFFHDLTWGQPDAFRVLYADAPGSRSWGVVDPPDDMGPAFGDHAVRTWKWTQSPADCPRLLPKWTFDPVVVDVPVPVRAADDEDANEPVWWPGEKAMAETLRAAQGVDVPGNWFTIRDFIGADGKLRRPFANYPHDWRAVQIASGLLAQRLRHKHGLMGTSVFRELAEAEREALAMKIRGEALAWFNRGGSYPPFVAVPQPERDEFWSWLEAYPWLVRFVIIEAVTLSIEASLVDSDEAASRIPDDVALRIRHRHALAVQSEGGLFASTPDRMLAPPADIQGHQWDRAKTHLLLLELSSNDGLGHHFGEGVYQFWITPADLEARRFDKVQLTADAY